MPEVLVTGGGGSLDGLAATLMRSFGTGSTPNGKDGASVPRVAAVEPPVDVTDESGDDTEVDAARLAEAESRPDDTPRGGVTP